MQQNMETNLSDHNLDRFSGRICGVMETLTGWRQYLTLADIGIFLVKKKHIHPIQPFCTQTRLDAYPAVNTIKKRAFPWERLYLINMWPQKWVCSGLSVTYCSQVGALASGIFPLNEPLTFPEGLYLAWRRKPKKKKEKMYNDVFFRLFNILLV